MCGCLYLNVASQTFRPAAVITDIRLVMRVYLTTDIYLRYVSCDTQRFVNYFLACVTLALLKVSNDVLRYHRKLIDSNALVLIVI